MTNDRGLLEFASQTSDEVRDRLNGITGETDDSESVFMGLMVERLCDLGVIEDIDVCTLDLKTSVGHVKVNGYRVDEEDQRVDLVTVIYRGTPDAPQLTRTEVNQSQVQAVRFFDLAVTGKLSNGNLTATQTAMVNRLKAAAGNITDVRVFILTDGIVPDAAVDGPSKKGISYRYEAWDIQRVYRCTLSDLPYESVRIDLQGRTEQPIECLRMPCPAADYEAYLCIFPGPLLNELYDEFGQRLLELNVRSFLQANVSVNRGIRDTIKNAPHRFLAYNNGISATAEEIELERSPAGGLSIKALCGLQIVNGGQTVASINRAARIDHADLSHVFVQAKITVIPTSLIDDLVPKVSRYANAQTKVTDADFSSNDSFHVELQRLSTSVWCPGERTRWFYERARGQFDVELSKAAKTAAQKKEFKLRNVKITKPDVAKYLAAWDQLPHIVGLGAQKNFVKFMDRLRTKNGPEWTPDQDFYRETIAKAILYKRCEELAGKKEIAFPAYGANAVAYTVAYLSHRAVGKLNFALIWQNQAISETLEATLRDWMQKIYDEIVGSANGRNVTEWCKKEACWEGIRALDLKVPEALRDELSHVQPMPTVGGIAGGRAIVSFEDRERIARIMNIPASLWLDIHGWGIRTGMLKSWQCGIALTLSGYASGKWEKVPSAKQAKHALDIIEIASQEFEIPSSL